MSELDEVDLAYLDILWERAKETRKTILGGRVYTSRAEAATIVLASYAPRLIAEVKRLRALLPSPPNQDAGNKA